MKTLALIFTIALSSCANLSLSVRDGATGAKGGISGGKIFFKLPEFKQEIQISPSK